MKKVLLGLSGIIIVAFLIVLVANAQTSTQEVKKSDTEVAKDCGKCAASAPCAKVEAMKKCDPSKCREMGCDPVKCKEGKCDPAVCKGKKNNSQGEAKKSGTASCSGCIK